MTENKFKEMSVLLDQLDLKYFISDEGINILNIPLELECIILDKCVELNVMLHYHIRQKTMYEGLYEMEQRPVGYTNTTKIITIEEPVLNWDNSKINYTLERY